MTATQFTRLLELVGDAGWVFAVPELEGDEDVPGMIIGTPEYVQSIIQHLPDDQPARVAKSGH